MGLLERLVEGLCYGFLSGLLYKGSVQVKFFTYQSIGAHRLLLLLPPVLLSQLLACSVLGGKSRSYCSLFHMAVVWKIERKQIDEGGEEACSLQVAFLETQCRTTATRII